MSIIYYPYIFKTNTVYWKVGTRQGLVGMETANKQWTKLPDKSSSHTLSRKEIGNLPVRAAKTVDSAFRPPGSDWLLKLSWKLLKTGGRRDRTFVLKLSVCVRSWRASVFLKYSNVNSVRSLDEPLRLLEQILQ